MTKKTITLAALFIWFLASLFYLYEFFLRVFISTISDQVMQDFHLTAQKFAIMGAGYYLAYSLMQIPVGILVDRFGARLLLTIAVVLAAIGGGWFACAHSFEIGFISRCFMGFGSSFAYVCLLMLALNWFPKSHFGLMVGLANLLGALGPFLAGGPLSLLLNLFDNNWRLILLM
ncbi:MAG: MFS transporter, partial [Simkaniaceae bacterium]